MGQAGHGECGAGHHRESRDPADGSLGSSGGQEKEKEEAEATARQLAANKKKAEEEAAIRKKAAEERKAAAEKKEAEEEAAIKKKAAEEKEAAAGEKARKEESAALIETARIIKEKLKAAEDKEEAEKEEATAREQEEEAAQETAMGGEVAAVQQEERTLGVAPVDPTDLFTKAFSLVQSPAKTPQSPIQTELDELAEEGMELLQEEETTPEGEARETPSPFREEPAVDTSDINQVTTILSELAKKNPYTNPEPQSLFSQSKQDRAAAAMLFTQGGDPAKFNRQPVRIARAKGLPNTLQGQAMTKEQAAWLEEQGTRVPLDAPTRAYRECEQGTWLALGTTLFTAPSIAEFNASTNNKAAQKIYKAESTWAVDDRVVWYTENPTSHDRHEANTFKLGRILGTPTNSQPIIVDLTPTSGQEKCVTTISKWQGERAETNAFSKSPGATKTVRTYNILPVTSALQMHIYPYWRLHNVNRNNPKELHTNPFFCKLNWDPQEVVRPENFAEGRYYFWLNPQDFQMGAWLCRGIANVPNEMAQSQAFAHLKEYLIPYVIDAFPARAWATPSRRNHASRLAGVHGPLHRQSLAVGAGHR